MAMKQGLHMACAHLYLFHFLPRGELRNRRLKCILDRRSAHGRRHKHAQRPRHDQAPVDDGMRIGLRQVEQSQNRARRHHANTEHGRHEHQAIDGVVDVMRREHGRHDEQPDRASHQQGLAGQQGRARALEARDEEGGEGAHGGEGNGGHDEAGAGRLKVFELDCLEEERRIVHYLLESRQSRAVANAKKVSGHVKPCN